MLIIKFLYRKINNLVNTVYLKVKRVKYDNTLKINGRIYIAGSGKNIFIGKNVKINTGKRANPIGGDTRAILSGNIIIGNNVGISNSALIGRREIKIEDNVMIGGGTKIYDTDFHSIEFEKRINEPDTGIKCKEIKIENGAFIGAHSIILKGVTIGAMSIVGAGSVVTHDIPPNEIWAGNPARFIRKI